MEKATGAEIGRRGRIGGACTIASDHSETCAHNWRMRGFQPWPTEPRSKRVARPANEPVAADGAPRRS